MDKENAACNFRDQRLKKRFRPLLQQVWSGMGQTIPFACQDWASTKAAYRFFANDQVCEQDIFGGHFQATRERFEGSTGPILVLQDTTTFSYQRDQPEHIGFIGKTRKIPLVALPKQHRQRARSSIASKKPQKFVDLGGARSSHGWGQRGSSPEN